MLCLWVWDNLCDHKATLRLPKDLVLDGLVGFALTYGISKFRPDTSIFGAYTCLCVYTLCILDKNMILICIHICMQILNSPMNYSRKNMLHAIASFFLSPTMQMRVASAQVSARCSWSLKWSLAHRNIRTLPHGCAGKGIRTYPHRTAGNASEALLIETTCKNPHGCTWYIICTIRTYMNRIAGYVIRKSPHSSAIVQQTGVLDSIMQRKKYGVNCKVGIIDIGENTCT